VRGTKRSNVSEASGAATVLRSGELVTALGDGASGRRQAAPADFGGPDHQPTPIRISRRARNLIILGVVVILAMILWAVPSVLVIALGGAALALVLSVPTRLFSRFVSRGLAILFSFLLVLVSLALVLVFLAPLLMEQAGALVAELPSLVQNLERYLLGTLETADRAGLLAAEPEQISSRIGEDLSGSLGVIAGNALGGALGLLVETLNVALTLFGVAFVGVSLLANVDGLKASYLAAVPKGYQRDAQELWDALGHALSRYLSGLTVILAIEGALTTIGLWLIGVPYALALGAWVSVTAVVPYVGAWLGAIPALLVAFSVSWTAVGFTALLYLAIQQLEGNILTPKIQGETINVPPVVVFLAVVAAGGMAGVTGVLLAVPALAVIRVLFDFFRVRLQTEPPEAFSPEQEPKGAENGSPQRGSAGVLPAQPGAAASRSPRADNHVN
jgi:predicted PurR-regulated permease PerM